MAEKEYIERGALLKSFRDYYGCSIECECGMDCPVTECGEGRIIMTAPAADVVEVVRCKDCVCGRHPNKSDRFEALYPQEYLYCCVHESGVKKDGYCSYGKRKEQT